MEEYKNRLESMYIDYCMELSTSNKQPIDKDEAVKTFNNYWNGANETSINILEDFEEKEIKGFIITRERIVEQIYVKPKFRNKGIGAILVSLSMEDE